MRSEVQNGGYYGINIYQCNGCLFWRVRSHDNYRHGFHPGSDTAGWGYRNSLVQCLADGNGVDGISERGTTIQGEQLHNTYMNILCHNNGRNGFIFAGGKPTSNPTTTYDVINCRAFENERHGISFIHSKVSAVNIVSKENKEYGVAFDGGNDISLVNPRIRGHTSPSGIGAAITRYESVGADRIVIYGGEVRDSTYNIALRSAVNTGTITLRDIDARGAGETAIVLPEDQAREAMTIRNVAGYPTTNGGAHARSNDGQTTTFRWPHELATIPDTVSVTPKNLPASKPFTVEADNTEIIVRYQQAPSEGEEKLEWWWRARSH